MYCIQLRSLNVSWKGKSSPYSIYTPGIVLKTCIYIYPHIYIYIDISILYILIIYTVYLPLQHPTKKVWTTIIPSFPGWLDASFPFAIVRCHRKKSGFDALIYPPSIRKTPQVTSYFEDLKATSLTIQAHSPKPIGPGPNWSLGLGKSIVSDRQCWRHIPHSSQLPDVFPLEVHQGRKNHLGGGPLWYQF